jgi:mannose-6-phosphate isomerase-like protein (cupin superfamily)
MADYTIENLRALDDQAPNFGLSDVQEARFATRSLRGEQTGLSLQRVKPGQRQQFGHSHNEDEEIYVVVRGSGRVKLDDEIVEMSEWDALRVAPKVMRCFEGGANGLEFLAFGAPATGMDDVESKPGWWSD